MVASVAPLSGHVIDSAFEFCRSGNVACLRSVCYATGMNVNTVFCIDRETLLHAAARFGHAPVVAFLLERGADVHARMQTTWMTPLFGAAQENHQDVISMLVRAGADIDARHKDGETALMLAVSLNNHDLAKTLLAYGADANLKAMCRESPEYTPLMAGVKFGDETMVSLLLLYGADVNAAGSEGFTPLHVAALHNNTKALLVLLENQQTPIDVNAVDEHGYTALNVAATHGSRDAVNLLLRFGANPNLWTAYSPLHNAVVSSGDVHIVDVLVAHGADVNARSEHGETALHMSANTRIKQALLRAGAE
jgi:ankyrin repeat protein